MLDGQDMVANFNTTYLERQPYLSNPTQIVLSRGLAIFDRDVGVQVLVGANITILNGKQKHCPLSLITLFLAMHA